MPDQRSVMKEYRSLEQKRAAQGLTPAEEARHAQLRDLIGPEMGAGALQGGFDVTAAAARLRDSLMPAGVRNRPPPPPEPPAAPEPEPAPSADDALATAYESQPFAPLESGLSADALFDPSTMEGAPAPLDAGALQAEWTAPAYDPAGDDASGAEQGAVTPGDDAATAGWDPAAEAYADPAYGEWAPAGSDPAGYDPAAAQPIDPDTQAAWDAAQPLDPNASYADSYDPNAASADSGAQPGWDPHAPFDPSAPPTWDPSQPFDPNAPWPAAPYEPGAAPQDAGLAPAWDPDAPFDPNAPPTWDPSQPFDPSGPDAAAAYDPAAAGLDAGAAPGWDPSAQAEWTPETPAPEQGGPLDVGAPFGEPEPAAGAAPLHADSGALLPPEGWEMAPPGPDALVDAPLGEYDETASAAPVGEDAGLESMLPFDAGAAEPEPGAHAELPVLGEYDDTAGFAGAAFPDAAPADLPVEGSGFEAAQAMAPGATEGWHPEPAVDEGFLLESGGSFDAAAAAVAPEWAVGAQAPPWESPEPSPGALVQEGAEPLATAAFPEPAFAEGDALAPPPGDALALEGASAAPAEPDPELPSFDVDVSDAFAEGEPALADGAGLDPAAAELAPADGDLALDPEAHAPDLSGPVPALDFSRPDLSEGQPEDDFASVRGAAPALNAPATAPASGAAVAPHADAVADEDIPTIDGEEILDEIPIEDTSAAPAPQLDFEPLDAAPPEAVPPPAPALVPPPPPAPAIAAPPPPPPPPPAAAAPPPPVAPPPAERVVAGVHRVVVHTVEGQVKRGVLEDADLAAASLGLCPQPGGAPELVGTDKVKAIFFMLSPGETPPAAQGKKVRVTFRDGRQIAGFSPDYDEIGAGFFMVPGDTRTNTGRIWVYRASVKQVTVS
jgi:hypothetical protein